MTKETKENIVNLGVGFFYEDENALRKTKYKVVFREPNASEQPEEGREYDVATAPDTMDDGQDSTQVAV